MRTRSLLLVCAVQASLGCIESSTSNTPDATPGADSGPERSGGDDRSSSAKDATPAVDAAGGEEGSPDAGATDARPGDSGGVPRDPVEVDRTVLVSGSSGAIQRYRFRSALSRFELLDELQVGGGPSFLAFHPTKPVLYAVQEDTGRLISISRTPAGPLAALGTSVEAGSGPAYVATDHAGAHAFAVNYAGGTVRVFPIGQDGTLGESTAEVAPGTNPHSILLDPADSRAWVPCKGSDLIAQYDFAGGQLSPIAPVETATGAGPRHIARHPSQPYAYVMNELDSTMTAYAFEPGGLRSIESYPSLPAGFNGVNTGADVHVDPAGRFVYGSNRGHDSIAIFAIEEATGRLTVVGHESTRGRTPRNFTLDESGDWLIVANQATNNIAVFRVDRAAGTLTFLLESEVAAGPQFVAFAPE